MHKRILALSLIIVIACASYVLIARHLVERDNDTVSFLMDGPDIVEHAVVMDIDPLQYLVALREAGLFGLVVPYDKAELRELAFQSDLAVVLFFHGDPLDFPDGIDPYDLSGVAGIAFQNSHTTATFLNKLNLRGELLFLIQRNDTFQGYLPSPVHAELIEQAYPAARTYRVSRLETDAPEYHPVNMIQRWLINIREYNTRAIYARPYFDGGLSKNTDYVSGVAEALTAAGYRLGQAEPMQAFSPPRAVVAVLVAAALLCTVLLTATLGFPAPLLAVGSGAAILVSLLSVIDILALPAKLLAALAGAVSASVLGIMWVLRSRRSRHFLVSYALVNLITVLLALGVAAVLSDTDFFMEYHVFRGVKIQYTAPLLILASYLAVRFVRVDGLKQLRESPPQLRWLLLLALVAISAVYIYRSGDVERISGLEAAFRSLLERTFVVRPRLKELLAHPVLMLSLYWRKRIPPLYVAVGLLLAAIGQVSMVNTFLHLRTPLIFSLIRTWHGLWIGTLLGLLAVAATKYVARAMTARRGVA